MNGDRIRVLSVEDNPGDVRLIRVLLAEAATSKFDLVQAGRLAEAERRVQDADFDVVLLDLSLPDASGLDTVTRARAFTRGRPVVVMTGLDDEDIALDALKAGADDYLVKGQFDSRLLVRAIRYAIERRRIRDELAEKNRELAGLNELKNQFLGMAAHDLRNPLGVIMTASSFMLEDDAATLAEERKKLFLDRIRVSSEFMLRMIDELLDVTRIESGNLNLELEEADIVGAIAENVTLNRMLADKKRIRLDFEPPYGLPRVRFDRTRMEQVLNNLVSNALKFSKDGTDVQVRASRMNGDVVVSVQDQGPGIPADELGKLFQPFSKTSVRSTAGEKSTGLGLAISLKIVEAHGGRIWAESEVGKGSVFHFSLPVTNE